MKNQYIGGDCIGEGGWLGQFVGLRGGLGKKEGVVFLRGGVDTPMLTMIILSYLELSRIDLPKLNSSILMEIVTIPVARLMNSIFICTTPLRLGFLKKLSLN